MAFSAINISLYSTNVFSAYNDATRNIQYLTYTENIVMYESCSQIHSPWLGDVVESGTTTLCQSLLYPPQSGTMNLATLGVNKEIHIIRVLSTSYLHFAYTATWAQWYSTCSRLCHLERFRTENGTVPLVQYMNSSLGWKHKQRRPWKASLLSIFIFVTFLL